MDKQNVHITDFDFSLIADFFKDLDRQGPCCEEITKLALQFIPQFNDTAHIADLGCGTGGQTITLAENIKGSITAIDLIPEFIESFNKRIGEKALNSRISTIVGSMDNLPFKEAELDLIWAEGSIYNIGYQQGLKEWRKYLKDGGYIAVSEASWYTESRPEEASRFWDGNYPGIDTIPNKVKQMQEAGYVPVAHFVMPDSTWWNYFEPAVKSYEPFLKRHNYSEQAKLMIKLFEDEIEIFRKYCWSYGYVFYIGRKEDRG